jgi:hypothetical protein
MTFADQMAADWPTFTDPTNGFGDAATFVPFDQSDKTFALAVTIGDQDPTVTQFAGGQEGRRVAPIFCQLSLVQAGILAQTSSARSPVKGDAIVIASGANAGTWVLYGPATTDMGDGCHMTGVLSTLDAPGSDAREVR